MKNDEYLLKQKESIESLFKKPKLEINEEKSESSHVLMPSPVLNTILEYGGLDKRYFFGGHANTNINEILTSHHRSLKEALLLHVVRGEQDQAEEIIQANPELLFESGTVKDFAGNTYVDYSPCQLARYAHDVDMLKMMKPYLAQVKDGEEQFLAILKEADNKTKEQKPYDFSVLAAAISSNNDAHIKKTLAIFRKHFEPREIKKENSFNIENLRKAYDIYVSNYDTWSVEQNSLFWRQVIGYCQRSLPACYAQAFCQGLYNVTMDNEPLKRELKLNDGNHFYPIDINGQTGLGYSFGVYSFYARWRCGAMGRGGGMGRKGFSSARDLLCEYIKQKTAELRLLMQRPNIEFRMDVQ